MAKKPVVQSHTTSQVSTTASGEMHIVSTGETVLHRRGLFRRKRIVSTSTYTTTIPSMVVPSIPTGVRGRVRCPADGCGNEMLVAFPARDATVSIACTRCGKDLQARPPG